MNPKTRAILKALGFVEDEVYSVLGVTDFVTRDKHGRITDLIGVKHHTRPDQIAALLMEHAVMSHKRRVRELRAALEREER